MTPQGSVESGELGIPAVVIHGGAGDFGRLSSPAQVARLERDLSDALEAAWVVLGAGGCALDSVVEAVAWMEASGTFNCGRGAVTTSQGTVETDAAVMDGTSGSFGAICAATWPESPVRAARVVMSLGGPAKGPVLLAGAGADGFCESRGLERRAPGAPRGDGVVPVSRVGIAIARDGRFAVAFDADAMARGWQGQGLSAVFAPRPKDDGQARTHT